MKNLRDFFGKDGGLYNCGSGLCDDSAGEGCAEDCFERIYAGKTINDYETLVAAARADGATVAERQLDALRTADIRRKGKRFYVTYNVRTQRLAISADTVTRGDMEKLGARHTKAGKCALYQRKLSFAIQHCGMSYFLVLPDHSMFVIDGGHPDQSSEEELKEMYDFMHRISETPEGEKLRVVGWYISHAHGDHLGEPAYFLEKYANELEIESFMFNFPSGTQLCADYNTPLFREKIRKYFPDAMLFKLHAGEVLKVCGAEIRVLYTHEDCADLFGRTMILDFNSSSTVIQILYDGIKAFFPGDIHSEAEAVITATFDAPTLRSDVLQVSHHCYNSLRLLYDIVRPPFMFTPQGFPYVDRDKTRSRVRAELLPYATGCFHYNDTDSYRITAKDGKVVVETVD